MSERIFCKRREAYGGRSSQGCISVSVYKGAKGAKAGYVTVLIDGGNISAKMPPSVLRQLAEDFNNAANVIETGDVYPEHDEECSAYYGGCCGCRECCEMRGES